MVKDVAQQQNNPFSLPLAPSAQTLATRVYCTHQVIALYDICNNFDSLSLNSETFQKCKADFLKYKAKVDAAMNDEMIDEASLDTAIKADTLFRSWKLFDDAGQLNDNILLEKMQKMYAERRDKALSALTQEMEADPLLKKEFDLTLNRYSIKDLEKFKANSKRGEPNKLREKLADDFALLQQTDPNNLLVKSLKTSVLQQTDKLPYVVYWLKEDKKTNHDLRDIFDNKNKDEANPRQKFLMFMGKLLTIGQDLTNNNKIAPKDISAKHSHYKSYYDDIRMACGNPDLSDADISQVAARAYANAVEGCWKHKQKCNPDPLAKKEMYVHNVNRWVADMVKGRNNIASLAFLTGKEAEQYKTSADEMWKDSVAAKHITVDHNTDLKYHPLFKSMEDKKSLHDIWNLTLIIGGDIHNAKTDATENTGGQINKCLINGVSYYKAKISKKPNNCLLISPAGSVSLERKEPEQMQKIRSGTSVLREQPSLETDFFKSLFEHDLS